MEMNMDDRFFKINGFEFKISYSFVEYKDGEEVLSELFMSDGCTWELKESERGPCKCGFSLEMVTLSKCEAFK